MQNRSINKLKLNLLGPFSLIWSDSQPCLLSGAKVKALLALLAAQPDKVWQRDSLVALLWPAAAQQESQASLRQTLYRLRKALTPPANDLQITFAEPFVMTRGDTIQINPAAQLEVDVVTFRRQLGEVKSHPHDVLRDCSNCLKKLETAVSLYRGDFLSGPHLHAGSEFEQWSAILRADLRRDVLDALDQLGSAYLDLAQYHKVGKSARRQLEINPLQESAQRLLMLSLAHSGEKAEAISQFNIYRQLLAQELEETPSAETLALYNRIEEGQLDSAVTPGRKLRDYLIIEELGQGDYGTIYRAWQPSLDREVAIKVILPQYAGNPRFIQRMEHEARLVAGLEHPHIVPIYDYWRDSNGIYFVMRRYQEDLNTRMEQEPLTNEEVLRFLEQVAGALHAVHEQGIIHRDIKPFNILIDDRTNFYLTDFGIALDPNLEDTQTPIGNSGYSAPEMLNNEPATRRSDIFSLGVILYQLLTGEPPTRQQQDILPSVRAKRPDLADSVDYVLRRATAVAAQDRYSDALALAGAFRQAMTQGHAQDHDQQIDSADIPSGHQIREYEIREKFAAGSFSAIYRAYQTAVQREVAIKVILPKFADQPDFMRRWETEAHIVARLEHPYIVPLYDYWRDSGGVYLVMRLLRGGNLRHRLDLGRLQSQEILLVMRQVAGALDAVHQRGIVHRDLKPSNILLDIQGNAYLTDFGIAKELEVDTHMTHPGTFLGSPAYISPEQLRNEAVTPQTDIYSLGIILYELLTGKHPFITDNLAPLIQQHLNEPLPSLLEDYAHLPVAVDWVLARATAKHPAARYNDVLAFLEDFEQALLAQPDFDKLSLRTETPAEPVEAPSSIVHRPSSPPAEPARTEPVERAEASAVHPPPSPFVARERQLTHLESLLGRALKNEGQILFVTGGAGRGKTSLLTQFTQQASAAHPQLLVARGICNATTAAGDPYLPFRELLGMLTADVDSRLRAGTISQEQARRLQAALPKTGAAIVEQGPELVDALISGSALLARGKNAQPAGSAWLDQLADLLASDQHQPGISERKMLFAHYTAVLHTLSQFHPLILVLDDLQWIDNASAALLFHLSRSLSGHPILFACAYRRDEVALGRNGERHPLEKVLAESKRAFGDIWINLAELQEMEEQHFVNTLLNQEPNRYSAGFRHALYDHTAGHALFTVELLRSMQERGDLQRDEDGRWFESDDLDWERLPWRIEGVIEERTNRLDEELRTLLTTAAVEGGLFTAEVLARVLDSDPRRVMHQLSRQLQNRHNLVCEQDELRIGGRYLTRYSFTHTLIQHYLYSQLSAGERRLLHAQVAEALEDLLQENWHSHAAALAWQYQQAGLPEKALNYWLWQGDQARATYAHAEAERAYSQAIEVLREQGQLELAGRTALKLALVYTADFQPQKAQNSYEQAFAWWDPARGSAMAGADALPEVTLRLALEQPSTLDPGLIDDDASTFMAAQLFEGLVRVGQEQTVLPALAQRWELLDGGKRYRFHLRQDAAWNDGRPLTAADFVYAFTRNLHPDTDSSSAHLLFVLKNARAFAAGELPDEAELGVSAADDYTLELILERPVAYLPHLMAHTVAFPLPRWAIETNGEQWTRSGQYGQQWPVPVGKRTAR